MKFVPLPLETAESENAAAMAADYRAGRGAGVITLGTRCFFFRKFWTVYYIPYERISRYFRRVETVPAQIGCCGGELRVENIVLCAANPAGTREHEIAQIQLPGEKAARMLMEEMRRLAPRAIAGKDTTDTAEKDANSAAGKDTAPRKLEKRKDGENK